MSLIDKLLEVKDLALASGEVGDMINDFMNDRVIYKEEKYPISINICHERGYDYANIMGYIENKNQIVEIYMYISGWETQYNVINNDYKEDMISTLDKHIANYECWGADVDGENDNEITFGSLLPSSTKSARN